MTKPHIRLHLGLWRCYLRVNGFGNRTGNGSTPALAYEAWFRKLPASHFHARALPR